MKYKHPYWTKYSASKNGSVYGSRGVELKPIDHHTGYSVMTVRNGKVQKQIRIHRFVWECMNGIIENDKVINHINGNKKDNRLENLELVTNRENIIHAWEKLGRDSVKGENKPQSKLTENQVLQMISLFKSGFSNKELGKMFNVHPNYVSLIRHNKRWRHLPR